MIYILLDIILTVGIYLSFPIVYISVKGKVPKDKAKKFSIINSIICATFFCILRAIITGGVVVVTSFAPAVLFYFINKLILEDKKNKNKQLQNKELKNTNEEKNEDIKENEDIEDIKDLNENLENNNEDNKSEKNKINVNNICQECGMELFEKETKCIFCGTEINRHSEKIDNDFDNINISNIKTNKKQFINEKNINIIKKLQKTFLIVSFFIIIFIMFFPLFIYSEFPNRLPKNTEETRLTYLNANTPVFYIKQGDYNYVYIKNKSNEIVEYKFYNSNNNGIFSATETQIRNYFHNITYGSPTCAFVMSTEMLVGHIIFGILLITIIIVSFYIYKLSKEEIFNLSKKHKTFKKLKNDFKSEKISKYNYKKLRKNAFSDIVMKDYKIFKLFKIFY